MILEITNCKKNLLSILSLQTQILEMYKDIVTRYFKMGAGQFQITTYRVSRAQEVINGNKREVEEKASPGKKVSHTKLLCLVQEVKADGLVSLYKKKELLLLCKGYGIAFQSRWNKRKLASVLTAQNHQQERMPCYEETSMYSVNIVCNSESSDRIFSNFENSSCLKRTKR